MQQHEVWYGFHSLIYIKAFKTKHFKRLCNIDEHTLSITDIHRSTNNHTPKDIHIITINMYGNT